MKILVIIHNAVDNRIAYDVLYKQNILDKILDKKPRATFDTYQEDCPMTALHSNWKYLCSGDSHCLGMNMEMLLKYIRRMYRPDIVKNYAEDYRKGWKSFFHTAHMGKT